MPVQPPTAPRDQLEQGSVRYEDVRVVVTPEAPRHYDVDVNDGAEVATRHAVERLVVNSAEVRLEGPIWFVEADLDVGIPVHDHGDTAWLWV